MRSQRHARGWLKVGAAFFVLAAAGFAGEKKTIQADDLLRLVVPAPNTRAIAARQGIPIGREELEPAQALAAPGDSVTALVQLGLRGGDPAPKQWVVRLRMEQAGAKGASQAARDETLYTNSGDVFVFHSAVAPMALETMGPVEADTEVAANIPVRRGHVLVNADSLTLNLQRTAGVIETLSAQKTDGRYAAYHIYAGPTAYPKEECASTRAMSEELGITVVERRSFAGAMPALAQFFDIMRGTPDLQPILMQLVAMPSVIDVLRHRGHQNIDFHFLGAGPSVLNTLFWGDHGGGAVSGLGFNIEVFGKPVLAVVLFVTDPVPPLEASAGILGAVAYSPTKPGKYVAIRIFSSRAGAGDVPVTVK